jgi:hypothetical protein
VAYTRRTRNIYKVLVVEHEGTGSLGRLRQRWENIKLNLKKWDGRGWFGSV